MFKKFLLLLFVVSLVVTSSQAIFAADKAAKVKTVTMILADCDENTPAPVVTVLLYDVGDPYDLEDQKYYEAAFPLTKVKKGVYEGKMTSTKGLWGSAGNYIEVSSEDWNDKDHLLANGRYHYKLEQGMRLVANSQYTFTKEKSKDGAYTYKLSASK